MSFIAAGCMLIFGGIMMVTGVGLHQHGKKLARSINRMPWTGLLMEGEKESLLHSRRAIKASKALLFAGTVGALFGSIWLFYLGGLMTVLFLIASIIVVTIRWLHQ